jgi:hypothetical protein
MLPSTPPHGCCLIAITVKKPLPPVSGLGVNELGSCCITSSSVSALSRALGFMIPASLERMELLPQMNR